MLKWARRALVVCLGLVLAVPEAALAATPAVGVVLQASRSRIGPGEASDGATLFAGDELITDAGGSLRVRVQGALVYLAAESAATLEANSAGIGAADATRVELERGGLGFSTEGAAPVELGVAGLTLRSKDGAAVHGQVRRVSANEVLVACLKGTLEATLDDESLTIAAGEALDLLVEQQQGQQVPTPTGTVPSGKKKKREEEAGAQGGTNPNPSGAGAEHAQRVKILKRVAGVLIAGGIIAAVIVVNTRPPASP